MAVAQKLRKLLKDSIISKKEREKKSISVFARLFVRIKYRVRNKQLMLYRFSKTKDKKEQKKPKQTFKKKKREG